MMDPINIANNLFNSQTDFARACGVSQPAVHKWLTGKNKPDAISSIAIERATKGVVTRAELRPDIFGEPEHAKDDAA